MAEAAADLRSSPAPKPANKPGLAAVPTGNRTANGKGNEAPAAAPAAPPPPQAPPPPPAIGSGTFILVRDRFTIFCDRPIPSLDMPNALAYEVADRKQEGRPLYALVCKPEMPTRVSVMRILKGLEIPSVLHMVDWGAAEWPPAERKCVIVIYHRPLGGRVMESLSAQFQRIHDHQFARSIIKPLADGLVELSQKGIAHRAIRPDNLYYLDEARTRIVLGDCVTSVPGNDQPVALETIESGTCHPSARGTGGTADDMYALGASILVLALGRNTLQGVSDLEIVRRKIQIGSYATLVADERVPVSLIECMRGMLADDPEQRWVPGSVDLWMNGKRLTPIQARGDSQAQRSFRFADQEFHGLRPLSYAMFQHWDKAAAIINDGSLEVWIRRGHEETDLADAIAGAIKSTGAMPGNKGDFDDLVIARVLMLLDPRMPVRWRDFCVFVDGFGQSLAVAMLRKQKLQPYTDFINRELWRFRISAQVKVDAEQQQFENVFKDMKKYLRDPNLGSGIERCLYELNEWQPCMSPLIDRQYVMEVKGVLPALENISKTVNNKLWPVDRHIAAFLRARYARGATQQIDAMNDSRPDRASIGMLSVLAIVQWRFGPPELHGLAMWAGGLMTPVIGSYQNRMKWKELEREIPRIIRKGDLAELFNYLDNPMERQKDAGGFTWAKAEYAAAERMICDLEHGQVDRQESAVNQGRQAGVVGAAIILFLTLAVVLLKRFL